MRHYQIITRQGPAFSFVSLRDLASIRKDLLHEDAQWFDADNAIICVHDIVGIIDVTDHMQRQALDNIPTVGATKQ